MKFLCEHCKAKYQIADEKVAGRTVRMKCRKCGGAIEVRAAVTETSVSAKASDLAAEGKPVPPKAPSRSAPLATSLSSSVRTAAPPGPAASSLAGAFQRNVQREEEATSAGFDVRELSAADEWYVAVNGVPVGPVRVGEVRRKAAMGAVTEDSLCWQEGMEEWRAIRTVTELAAVVREAASGGRSSQLPPEPRVSPVPPGARPGGARSTGQHNAVAAASREAAKAPLSPAWAAKASASGMEAQRPARPADFSEEDGAPTLVGRSPLLELEAATAAAAAGASNGAGAHADPFRVAATDPFKAPAPDPFKPPAAEAALLTGPVAASAPPAPMASPFAAPQPMVPGAPQRFSPIGIGVIVMFACFGLAAAYFMFTKKDAPPVAVAPPTAATAAPTAAPTTAPTAAPTAAPTVAAATAAPTVDAGPVKVASTGSHLATGTSPGTAKTTTAAPTDPALRDLIAGTSTGPQTGPSGGGSGGGGAQLTEDEIKSVVSQHNLGVRRTCWDRSSTTTASVNVTVHIVIAGSGQVTQANATGNDPVVAHCLEEEIKRWRWPGGGEVNVPFHFLRQ